MMAKLLLSTLIFLIIAVLIVPAQPKAPSRKAKGQVLTSTQMPAVRLEFGKKFKYAGGHSFILYNVATAEQHFFVDADKEGRIKRLYWIQFEGYLPDNTHSYDYKSPKTVDIGGLDFFADAYARNINTTPAGRILTAAASVRFLKAKATVSAAMRYSLNGLFI